MKGPARKILPFGQILLVIMGIVVLYLAVDLSRLVSVGYQRRQELRRVEAQLTAAQARQSELQAQLAYARSEAAVDEWARDNGLVRAGEVPVVIVAPEAEGRTPPGQQPAGDADPATIREAWWRLFFGWREGW